MTLKNYLEVETNFRKIYGAKKIDMPLGHLRQLVVNYLSRKLTAWLQYREIRRSNFESFSNAKFNFEFSKIDDDGMFDTDEPYCSIVKTQNEHKFSVGYKSDNDEFVEMLNFAQAIAYAVLCAVPKYCGEEFFEDRCEILYFAQRVLLLYNEMDNGAVLKYGLGCDAKCVIDNIVPRIEEAYPSIKPSLTNGSKQSKIDALFNAVFPENMRRVVVLRNEKQILEEWICRKYENDMISLNVRADERNLGNEGTLVNLIRLHNELYIRYPTDKNIFKIDWNCKIKRFNAKRMASLIMSHEMAHVAMHLHMSKEQRVYGGVEQCAAYWSRLLLERRELFYNGGLRNDRFDAACEELKIYIRALYGSHGRTNSWIEAVCQRTSFEVSLPTSDYCGVCIVCGEQACECATADLLP
jgi:hypothetical protein